MEWLCTATFKVCRVSRVTAAEMTASLTTSHRSSDSLDQDHRALERAGLRPLVPVRPPLHLVEPEGQLQVHTATYRGSFSSVLSQAMLSLIHI